MYLFIYLLTYLQLQDDDEMHNSSVWTFISGYRY